MNVIDNIIIFSQLYSSVHWPKVIRFNFNQSEWFDLTTLSLECARFDRPHLGPRFESAKKWHLQHGLTRIIKKIYFFIFIILG